MPKQKAGPLAQPKQCSSATEAPIAGDLVVEAFQVLKVEQARRIGEHRLAWVGAFFVSKKASACLLLQAVLRRRDVDSPDHMTRLWKLI